jgi:hypothetical protein
MSQNNEKCSCSNEPASWNYIHFISNDDKDMSEKCKRNAEDILKTDQ